MFLYIRKFKEINITDVPVVGGKNASLGELYNRLVPLGINVPDGFATTTQAFQVFLNYNNLQKPIATILSTLNRNTYANLNAIGSACRELILNAKLPESLKTELLKAYRNMDDSSLCTVAVRSSATAEDLPNASFAGQHESFLNIVGEDEMLHAVQKCFASLYTDRAIQYREQNGFDHNKVALSVGIQKMIRSDKSSAGVCFTLEPESGFKNVIHIAGAWGLGENVVQGTVNPDEFLLFKPTLLLKKNAIIKKELGSKKRMMVYGSVKEGMRTKIIDTPEELQQRFVLDDREIHTLGNWALIIEIHYGVPMDIEWAKDGISGELFILQARPETVHGQKKRTQLKIYEIDGKYPLITKGVAVGEKIVSGIARILKSPEEASILKNGDILVTELTSPDWDPYLKDITGIITDKGGRTSHASIIAREMGVPAIVGCENATQNIKEGSLITISCAEGSEGKVYEGKATWTELTVDYNDLQMPRKTDPMLIISDPDQAFKLSFYPNKGVGLLRMEFIINNVIGIHPMALVHFNELKDTDARKQIERTTQSYPDKQQYFIENLARGIGTIAAAFYPKDVIVRMSDFKTNEYAHLTGGKDFEPVEENPMLGFRGASRYYHPLYKEGFKLECAAMKKVRDEMGFTNVKLMIPFCRTVAEGKEVIDVMKSCELIQKKNGLDIYMMAEIPSNILQADEFAAIFDGFSIGSNDLTQLVLGIDRDSPTVSSLFSEQNKSVMKMISLMIRQAKAMNKKVGLCGQAPSDCPEFAAFLVRQNIDSISFSPDALIKGIENMIKADPNSSLAVV